MLAIAEQEFLAPRKTFRDVHMDVLRRLQIDQDEGPEHGMGGGKADHQPRAGHGIAGARREPRRQPPDRQLPARARSRGQN